MQVYCIGLRAGSNALKQALVQLGYPRIYSMGETVQYYAHLRAWQRHADGGKPIDFARFLAPWDAAKAHPAMWYPEQVLAAFPDAKVILLQRDATDWFRSYRRMVGLIGTLGAILWFVPRLHAFHRLVSSTTFAELGPGDGGSAGAFVAAHERLYERAIARVPPEQILRYDVRDGWEPLCAFLDRPVPDVPFPRSNRRQSAIRGAVGRGLLRDACWIGAAVAIAAVFGLTPLTAALLAAEVGLFGLLYALKRA